MITILNLSCSLHPCADIQQLVVCSIVLHITTQLCLLIELLHMLFQEVKREEIEQQMALANNPGRRDDRDRERDRRRPRENRSSQMSDEGWSVASTKGRQFDSARLKTFSRVSAFRPLLMKCFILVRCTQLISHSCRRVDASKFT